MISARYRSVTYLALALLGAGYFGGFSQLDLSLPFLKIYAAMVPIQLAALLYVVYIIRRQKPSGLE